MRIIAALLLTMITAALVVVLDRPVGSLPALGRLLDPINGWAANAEDADKDFSADFAVKGLRQPVSVWFEDRMVPHVLAGNDHDLYLMQGYIHAYFRLWQMDMQTRGAAGRVGEIVGGKWVTDEKTGKKRNVILEFDRGQRRKGMVYAAENSLKAIEADPRSKEILDAYTAGVNRFIEQLSYKDYPLEYKLMSFEPEPWDNLKSALLMKYMADDLTGYTEDFPLTALRDMLPEHELDYLFPRRTPGSIPVIPAGTPFEKASMPVPSQPSADNTWAHFPDKKDISSTSTKDYETGIGSNNWAISGNKTASGAPILCNDPHLGLNLPSLWFEIQLQSPSLNVYGVSLPGAPGVVIGFNDSISWGLTNNYRDVKDFYEIESIDKSAYRFDGKSMPFDKRIEIIKIKGQPDFIDKVNYTLHGPVIYDERFHDPLQSKKQIALTWMAHRGSNEILSIYLLNRAVNYQQFTEGLMQYKCPAQNFVYADRQNNIAMWGQGQFVNKWKDQGRYVMKGNTSTTLWGKDIPMQENPHVLNPPQDYLVSANQVTTDSSYPYWYNGYFYDFREWEINFQLGYVNKGFKAQPYMREEAFNPLDSLLGMNLTQTDVSSQLAFAISEVEPYFNGEKEKWTASLRKYNTVATEFQIWWALLCNNIWSDELSTIPQPLFPRDERTMQIFLTDSTSRFYDDISTDQIETRADIVNRTYQQMHDSVDKLRKQLGSIQWYKVKGTQLTHLAKIEAFSYRNLEIGGWGNTINAVKKTHGPSWRMIVEMGKDQVKAYGVYPGGQSGNPGSPYYGTFVNNWVQGKYYDLLFLSPRISKKPKQIKYTWNVSKG